MRDHHDAMVWHLFYAAALFAGFKDAGARADVGLAEYRKRFPDPALAPDTEAADGSTSTSKEGTA